MGPEFDMIELEQAEQKAVNRFEVLGAVACAGLVTSPDKGTIGSGAGQRCRSRPKPVIHCRRLH